MNGKATKFFFKKDGNNKEMMTSK